ncbi:MAG TPA: DNA-directed RNA polymerase subunit D [Hadesarchaea archaeon]|nr:DNA-directed RNA polymerase subunit D [Hadesarchaea archaeon]
MQLEIRKLDDDEMEFVLSGSNPAFANSLRRVAMREVPIMAIDEVEFKTNDSAMYDEIIAHRLALVPLRTPIKGYNLPTECSCQEGRCPKCGVELTLKKEGPTTVTSGDLKSSDDEVKPVSDSIPITRLGRGQKLELTAIARLGLGKEHTKWQPGIVTYKYMPVLEFDEKTCNACGECVKACPKNILEVVNDKIMVKDPTLCTLCKACIEACSNDAVKVSGDSTKFIFRAESSGALSPDQLILQATKVLEDKFEEFSKLANKL